MENAKKSDYPLLTCTPKSLPTDAVVEAARIAREINPLNHPSAEVMLDLPAVATAGWTSCGSAF